MEKTMNNPYEMCPSFNTCSANKCPLDPQIGQRNWHKEDPKCNVRKESRLKIGEMFSQALPHKGFTEREWSAKQRWVSS